jgi:hypothetical protein
MKTLIFILLFFFCFSSVVIANEAKSVSVNESKVILYDGNFENLPDRFYIDESKKFSRWGWGNWSSSYGFANIGFSQLGPSKILTESGMLSKKILKNWGVENYKLGKKKGFKTDGKRALAQLVEIDNLKCAVVISRFGVSSGDVNNRFRSTVDGYFCKNSGNISIEEGMNFLHCLELKNKGSHFMGKSIDDKCSKNEVTKKVKNSSSETNNDSNNKSINNNEDSIEERLKKLKSLFDKELINKKEYEAKRKEILDEM